MIEKTRTIVDQETGEIIEQESVVIKKLKPHEFIQVYLEDMSGLIQLKSISETKILYVLWRYSNYIEDDDSYIRNKFILDKSLKDKIINETGFVESTIKNTISSLVKRGIIIKDKKHKMNYYLNPAYFFKGALSDRAKCYSKIIQYQIEE